MTGTTASRMQCLRMIPCPSPAESLLLPVSVYPVPGPERELLLRFMVKLSIALATQWKLSSEIFIHITPSKNPSAGAMISPNARDWLPELGQGVWPARCPPSLWTKEDFADLDPGQLPRDVMHPTFRISKDGGARERARATMFGTGAILEILTRDPGAVLVKRGTDLLLPAIQEPALRSFPYYLPLLDAASIQNVSYDQLHAWLCGGSVYLRESIEDGGLLVIALQPISPVLKSLGVKPDPQQPGALQAPLD
jgi:hypothetical protein